MLKVKIEKETLKVNRLQDFQIVETLNEDFNATNIIYCPELYEEKDIVE